MVCPLLSYNVSGSCTPYRDVLGPSVIWGALWPVLFFSTITAVASLRALIVTRSQPRTVVGVTLWFVLLSAILRIGYFGDVFQLYWTYPYILERIWWDTPFLLTHSAYPVLICQLVSAALIVGGDIRRAKFFQQRAYLFGFLLCVVISILPMVTNRIVEAVRFYGLAADDFEGQWAVFVLHNRIACFAEYWTWWIEVSIHILFPGQMSDMIPDPCFGSYFISSFEAY